MIIQLFSFSSFLRIFSLLRSNYNPSIIFFFLLLFFRCLLLLNFVLFFLYPFVVLLLLDLVLYLVLHFMLFLLLGLMRYNGMLNLFLSWLGLSGFLRRIVLLFLSRFSVLFIISSLWFVFNLRNNLMICWLMVCLLDYFMFCFVVNFMLDFMLNFMLHFGLYIFASFLLNFVLSFSLGLMFCFMLNFVLYFMLNFMLYFMLALLLSLRLHFMFRLMLRLFLNFSTFWLVLLNLSLLNRLLVPSSDDAFGSLLELFWDISNCRPILSMLFLLSAHLDEEPTCEYFFIKTVSNEIDSVDSSLEYNLERPRIVFLDLDELIVGEGLFNILLNSVEVALDEVEGDMLDLVTQVFNLINQILLLGDDKLLLLLLTFLHQQINTNIYIHIQLFHSIISHHSQTIIQIISTHFYYYLL